MGYGNTFKSEFEEMQAEVHDNSKAHGWWEESDRILAQVEGTDAVRAISINETAAKLALIHSEVSEALEALRDGDPPSQKIGNREVTAYYVGLPDKVRALSQLEEELADVVIRCMDLAGRHGLRLASAIAAKHAYNKGRPYKHGGKRL